MKTGLVCIDVEMLVNDERSTEAVGDRFYKATAERQRLGILWESECGPPSAGWFEFRYFVSGSQSVACTSEPIRAIRKFASIASDGKNLFIYNEEGIHRLALVLDKVFVDMCAPAPRFSSIMAVIMTVIYMLQITLDRRPSSKDSWEDLGKNWGDQKAMLSMMTTDAQAG